MPLPIIEECFRVAFDWTTTADTELRATNVMHFSAATLDAGEVLDAIAANVSTDMWRTTSTTCELVNLTCWALDGVGLAEELPGAGTADWKGAQSAGQISPQVATVVSLKTPLRGRSRRGRVFVPWVAEAATDAGALVEAQAALMETAWNQFIVDMAAAAAPLCIASYLLEEKTIVTSAVVRRRTGTIRRRQNH